MKTKLLLLAAAAAAIAAPATAQAPMRALSDPVVGHPNPESLFTSPDPVLNRNKQAALHIQRELLKCHEWSRASEHWTLARVASAVMVRPAPGPAPWAGPPIHPPTRARDRGAAP